MLVWLSVVAPFSCYTLFAEDLGICVGLNSLFQELPDCCLDFLSLFLQRIISLLFFFSKSLKDF